MATCLEERCGSEALVDAEGDSVATGSGTNEGVEERKSGPDRRKCVTGIPWVQLSYM